MSEENVEVVLGVYRAADVDYVALHRDDSLWAELAKELTPFVHTDLETVLVALGSEKRYAGGLDGLRAFLVDWLAPWTTYRIENHQAIDLGERVLVLSHDCGRREGSSQEVRGSQGALWTIRDGKVARLIAYGSRAEALKAVGLEE